MVLYLPMPISLYANLTKFVKNNQNYAKNIHKV